MVGGGRTENSVCTKLRCEQSHCVLEKAGCAKDLKTLEAGSECTNNGAR